LQCGDDFVHGVGVTRSGIAGCEGRAWISAAFGLGGGEREEGTVAVGEFAFGVGRLVEVPAGEGAERDGDVGEADAGALVAVGVDLRD
jgi:hypothetical protein